MRLCGFFLSIIFLSGLGLDAYASKQSLNCFDQFKKAVSELESFGKNGGCPVLGNSQSDREIIGDMAAKICSQKSLKNKSEISCYLKSIGGEEIIKKQGMEFDDFVESIQFFLNENKKISKLVDKLDDNE